MAEKRASASGGRALVPAASAVMGDVRRASRSVERSRRSYRAAVVAAVDELEHAGVQDPFAQVAAAAGVSRQSVRELYQRARDF